MKAPMATKIGSMAVVSEVWPLTQFFSVSFLYVIIDLPGGQINDPFLEKHFSLPFLPATPTSPSRTLEGLFELTWRCRARCVVPRTPSKLADTNLDCAFVDYELVYTDP